MGSLLGDWLPVGQKADKIENQEGREDEGLCRLADVCCRHGPLDQHPLCHSEMRAPIVIDGQEEFDSTEI